MHTLFKIFFVYCFLLLVPTSLQAFYQVPADSVPRLENPITVAYLKTQLRGSHPRLVLNSDVEKKLRERLKTDPVVQNMYRAIQRAASQIPQQPLLERKKIGKRLLSVSREMLYRMNMLGMTYRIDKNPAVLKRINEELLAVCQFSDWNPSHFLDVGEMSMAVAIALDWTAGALPKTTVSLAEKALIEKGIQPSWQDNEKYAGWAHGTNNWNQVCNGGMIAASIAIAERDPELAAKTLHRALDGLPHALVEYMPSGIYPEGSTYWDYGTGFSVMSIAMLESAFQTDFGYGDYPCFKESATFRVLANAPSGLYYNFSDCGDRRGRNGDIVLAWFASKTGNGTFFERDRFLTPPDQMGKLSRLDGAGLVWLSQFEEKATTGVPQFWTGKGPNPLAFFTGGENDPHHYYFGGKGGMGKLSHGNMDGGSFVFELDGVRWSVDPGTQEYEEVERTGFDLWGSCQDCDRWKLLTKNNFGHSTLTVNDQLFRVDGMSSLIDFKEGAKPEATFDLSASYGSLVKSVTRKFVKDSPVSLTITDRIAPSEETRMLTWQLITTAGVELVEGGAVLRQDGKELRLENLSHPDFPFTVIALDPPPLALDRKIPHLKRIELRVPAGTLKQGEGEISVRLRGAL